MSVKRYHFYTSYGMKEDEHGEFVKYEDYEYLSDYCDHLVSFSKLPCLPKDLEILREANSLFAEENYALRQELERYKKEYGARLQ